MRRVRKDTHSLTHSSFFVSLTAHLRTVFSVFNSLSLTPIFVIVLFCLPPFLLTLSPSILLHSFIPDACLDSLSFIPFLSLSLSPSFNLLPMLMDFTAGGHSGLLLKSSVSEMCVIFLLNWIICIYLPPSVLTPALTRENMRAF